ncbi:hypothetical protein AB5I41_17505 [Sphingomonas sp. MMS24-JH45]
MAAIVSAGDARPRFCETGGMAVLPTGGRRPRIAFVINSISAAAAPNARSTRSCALAGSGWRPTSSTSSSSTARPRCARYPRSTNGHRRGDGAAASVRRLRRLLRGLQPDLVVGFLARANVATAFSAEAGDGSCASGCTCARTSPA